MLIISLIIVSTAHVNMSCTSLIGGGVSYNIKNNKLNITKEEGNSKNSKNGKLTVELINNILVINNEHGQTQGFGSVIKNNADMVVALEKVTMATTLYTFDKTNKILTISKDASAGSLLGISL